MRRFLLSFCTLSLAQLMTAYETTDTIKSHIIDEIVVTGTNNPVRRNLLPYTVTMVSDNQLEATGNTQLLSAISGMVPSLFVTERNIYGFGVSNGGSGHIKMRGIGGDRASAVLMMVDGQPQFAGLYSHHIADFYGAENIERVEILRGPASVLYGSNAMAGVINVITKDSSSPGIKTTLSSQYGSYNTWLSSLTNTTRFGRFSSIVSLGYNRTDGIKTDFDFNQVNAYAKLGYELNSNWNVKADYSFMTFNGNDPIYPTLKGQNGIYHQKVIRGEASLSAFNSYGKTNGVVRAYYSYGNHFIHDPGYFHSLDDRLGLIVYQNFIPWKDASASLGIDFDRYTGKIPISGSKDHAQNPMATLDRKAIIEYSPYITLQQYCWHKRIAVNVGLRIANSNMFGTEVVPQIGVMISPYDGWTMKTSVAKGYRNPSFREMYLYKFANPDLQPEKMWNYEISISKNVNRYFGVEVTGYLARGSSLIQQTSTLNMNTGSFINKGIEASFRSNPTDNISIWAMYSYLHTSLSDLTGAPKNQYYFGASWKAFKGFKANAELKGITGLFVADDIDIQNYATLNMRFSYQIIPQLELFTNLDNITATKYIINKGYPMPGITVIGGFKLIL